MPANYEQKCHISAGKLCTHILILISLADSILTAAAVTLLLKPCIQNARTWKCSQCAGRHISCVIKFM